MRKHLPGLYARVVRMADVSTRVGMAPDLIEDGVNGGLVEVEDVEGLTERCLYYSRNEALADTLRQRGLETVRRCSWPASITRRSTSRFSAAVRGDGNAAVDG